MIPGVTDDAGTTLPGPPTVTRPEGYLKLLHRLLISASFFEGYDSSILALVITGIQASFNVSESQLGIARGLIELGLFFAFFITRLGDRVGRRKLLLWTVVGYTISTTLTAFSWDLVSFSFFQHLSRVFGGAEYAVAITMIVEEFPATKRASALGRLLLFNALGAIVVALLLVAQIDKGPLEWRTLYLIGLLPLVALSFFRRRIQETQRFLDYQAAKERGTEVRTVSFWEPWRPEYRRNLVLVGLVHLMRSLPLFGSTAWFFYYGEREAGVSPDVLVIIFIAAYGIGIAGYGICGLAMERFGRRRTAVTYLLCSIIFATALFQVREPALLGLFLILGVFFGLGVAPVMGAMATELFPTNIRNQAAAWARNVFEIAGYILGPLLVGVLGDHYTGVFGSVGDTVTFLFIMTLPGVWLIWRYLPETQGKELEEIAAEVAGIGYAWGEP
jgi:putative MFS transporter